MDIKIFTSMNNILKEKSRKVRDEVKTLDLKRESLNDKVKMQEKFILDVETRGKEDIEQKKKKKDALADEICVCIMQNEDAEDTIFGLKQEQEKLTNTTTTLAKLNTLKGQIGNKVSTITKEHKFFSENVTCPTCTQSIEESFRLNRISHAQTKAKELKSGYEELEKAIELSLIHI